MEIYIGTILPWALDWVRQGFVLCDGRSLVTSQNSELYSLIGTKNGGDSTTFKVPDYVDVLQLEWVQIQIIMLIMIYDKLIMQMEVIENKVCIRI